MPRPPRYTVFKENEIGVYRCVKRCLWGRNLCGPHGKSRRSLDHRKGWVAKRIAFLTGYFGVEVLAHQVKRKELHVILRNRPDLVKRWSNSEVIRRWRKVFPGQRNPDGSIAPPTPAELLLAKKPKIISERRRRLSHISWFIRCLVEPIARQANREDDRKGDFWKGRFKCQALLDESSLAARKKRRS